jgi:hypothetical protein
MLIYCTKKLLKELDVYNISETEEDNLLIWHANVINEKIIMCLLK